MMSALFSPVSAWMHRKPASLTFLRFGLFALHLEYATILVGAFPEWVVILSLISSGEAWAFSASRKTNTGESPNSGAACRFLFFQNTCLTHKLTVYQSEGSFLNTSFVEEFSYYAGLISLYFRPHMTLFHHDKLCRYKLVIPSNACQDSQLKATL